MPKHIGRPMLGLFFLEAFPTILNKLGCKYHTSDSLFFSLKMCEPGKKLDSRKGVIIKGGKVAFLWCWGWQLHEIGLESGDRIVAWADPSSEPATHYLFIY